MQVVKWGDDLAVRLPAEVVEALHLKEGDQVEVRPVAPGEAEVEHDRQREREDAIETMKRLARPMPPGFKFNRMDAYERD